MARSYSIEQADGISTIRLHRRLGLDDLLAVIDEAAASDLSRRRLWDVTGALKFTAEQMRAIATRGRQHWSGPARVAYLATDDLSFGLARMFEAFREQESYETRVFRDEAEARRWLEDWTLPAATGTAQRFVAGGEADWWRSPEGVACRRQIEAGVRARYQTDLEIAGWFKGALLELRIRREVAAACTRILWAAETPEADTPEADDRGS